MTSYQMQAVPWEGVMILSDIQKVIPGEGPSCGSSMGNAPGTWRGRVHALVLR